MKILIQLDGESQWEMEEKERKSGFGENEGGERGRGKNHECVQRHSDAGRVSSQRHISWFETKELDKINRWFIHSFNEHGN